MTAQDAGKWLAAYVEERGELIQVDAIMLIHRHFGKDFTYMNRNGGCSIDREVLRYFKKLTTGKVRWERGYRAWMWIRQPKG